MQMKPRSQAKINGQVRDKKPQGAVTDDGKSPVISKHAQNPNEAAARCVIVEDQEWIAFERALSALKEALGTDDEDFCKGILRQLEAVTPYGDWGDQTDFHFVLSVLKDEKPVDKLHAMQVVQMTLVHLAAMKQTQILLKPVRFELPDDFKQAIHNAQYDTSRLDKQKIKVDDLPARQAAERMVSRLMQTYAVQLQTSAAYRRSVEASKLQQLSAITIPHKVQNTGAARSSQGLNGSGQSAALFNGIPKQQTNSINGQKNDNDRASS